MRLSRPVHALPGDDSTADGPMVIETIDRAIDTAMGGKRQGPLRTQSEKPVVRCRFLPGHTEYLGERAGLDAPPVMLLVGPNLKVVPVTIHLSRGTRLGR